MKMQDYVRFAPTQLSHNLEDGVIDYSPMVDAFMEKARDGITIIASGSSYNSSLMVVDAIEKAVELPVYLETPERAKKYPIHCANNNFIIVISQSGESTNIISCIKALKEQGIEYYLVTGNLNGLATKISARVQDYGVGNEYVDFVTLGVQTLVLFLLRFAEQLRRARFSVTDSWDFKAVVNGQTQLLNATDTFIKNNKMLLSEPAPTFFVGTGPNFGVAKEGALKFQETLKRPAMYYETEEFLHGPAFQLTPKYTVFLIDEAVPSARVSAIFEGLRSVTNKAYLITSSKKYQDDDHVIVIPTVESWELNPLVAIPPIQLIAGVVTDYVDQWDTHPYFKKFSDKVAIKADDYQEQLASIKNQWNEHKADK